MDKAPDPVLKALADSTRKGDDHERLASGWLAHLSRETPKIDERWSVLDHTAHAAMSNLSGGLSPVSLALAQFDWAMHLALSPGKQTQLATDAWSTALSWARFARGSLAGDGERCIEPLPQDRRFVDPAWQELPYQSMVQAFLLTQRWWHKATTGVPGATKHHEDMMSFGVRQWLDRWAPSNFISTNPVVRAKTQQEGGANLWQGWLNALDDWQRELTGQRPAGTESFVAGKTVATTPGKVILRNHLIELIQYTPTTPKVHAEPVLVVPAWIMKYYILDLSPHNSLIRWLVDQGHTVFTISWKNPDPRVEPSDRDISFDDYRTHGIMAALDAINTISPKAPVHLTGYCLGGTLSAIAAAQMARDGDERLASLTLLAAQVDFEEPGEISLFLDDSQVTFLEDGMRKRGVLEGKQMAGAFQMLRSNDLIWSYRLQNYLLGNRQPVNDLMAWNADATRLPMRMHSEYLNAMFLGNQLAIGRYLVDGQPVALSDIRVPIFSVGTLTDHVSPWRSVYKLHLLSNTDLTFALTNGGHNAGIVSEPGHKRRHFQALTRRHRDRYLDPDRWLADAPRYEGSWWPHWQQWLATHSSAERSSPPRMGLPGSKKLADAPGDYVHQR